MHSPEFAGKLWQLTVQQHFDLVQIDCTPMAPYRNYISPATNGSGRTRTALVFIDVNAYKYRRLFDHERAAGSRLRWWLDWRLMRGWEARYAANFDACVMMSDVDAQRVRQHNPQLNTVVIPNGVDITEKQLLPERTGSADILLIGTLSHAPWKDAVHYFHDCIFPLIEATVPQARMLVVGNAPDDIAKLASGQVLVTGRVSEVLPSYERACLSVVPLRSGGGTRLKILEALAYGRPVVSTSIGSEGLDLCPGRDLLIADEPDEFARQVIHLLTDPSQRRPLIQEGRRTVETRYGWDTIADQLLTTYEQLCTT
jgi:glycosyltransferase involved in cell wall biosynthesis